MSDPMISIRNFYTQESANVCKAYLAANGISSIIANSNFPAEIADLPIARMGQVELLVLESDLVPALAFLQLADAISGRNPEQSFESRNLDPIHFLCEFCQTEIIYVPDNSSIINCPNCLEYVDVPEPS